MRITNCLLSILAVFLLMAWDSEPWDSAGIDEVSLKSIQDNVNPKPGIYRITKMTGKITSTVNNSEEYSMPCEPGDPAYPLPSNVTPDDDWYDSNEELLEDHYIRVDADKNFYFSLGFQDPEALEPGFYTNDRLSQHLPDGSILWVMENCLQRFKEACEGSNPSSNDCTMGIVIENHLEECRELSKQAKIESPNPEIGGGANNLAQDGTFWGVEFIVGYLSGTALGGESWFIVSGSFNSSTTLSGEWNLYAQGNTGMCTQIDQGSGQLEAVWVRPGD